MEKEFQLIWISEFLLPSTGAPETKLHKQGSPVMCGTCPIVPDRFKIFWGAEDLIIFQQKGIWWFYWDVPRNS